MPLAAAALELMQRLRDVRAQQAALYGMYEHDLLHAVQQQGPYGQGPGKATAAAGGGSSGGGLWASLLPPMPPPPPQPLGAVAAAAAGAAAGAAPGAAGLAHLDSLAGDGRAVALFLTDLARELEPRVEAQVGGGGEPNSRCVCVGKRGGKELAGAVIPARVRHLVLPAVRPVASQGSFLCRAGLLH